MKHIKIEVLKTKWGNKVLRIVEQTHRGNDFGVDDCEFEHNGFYLRSGEYPEIHLDGLYVRGDDERGDNWILCVRSEEWLSALRDAVKAYNHYFVDYPQEGSQEGENIEIIE